MSSPSSIPVEPILDPRGEFRRRPADLAQRLASLQGKTVLLFDNSQLTTQLPAYGPIFRWLEPVLRDEHGATCTHRSRNLLKEPRGGLSTLAEEIAGAGVDGVVIALCNAGITQPTSLFAAELERSGIPCVQMCTELGLALAGITASSYVPGLPIVRIDRATGDEQSFGRAETLRVVREIIEGLTGAHDRLLARFAQRFAGVGGRSQDGMLAMPEVTLVQRPGGATARLDPGRTALDAYETLCASQLCDGLPVIPPTAERVAAMLACTDRQPDDVLLDELPPSGASLTVRALAINAVMAGCRPEYMTILMAAFEAIADPVYRAYQGAITTHPSGNAVIVSGPLAAELGIQSSSGCLGPGFRANATIGRAVNLTIMNVARAIPGKSDLTIFGSPAEYTYCFAENTEANPWLSLHADLYGVDVTSVTVHKCEGPHNVLDPRAGPVELLRSIAAVAATRGGNNAIHPSQLLVLITPSQARMIAAAGWSKQDVKACLFEMARNPVELIQQHERGTYPAYFQGLAKVPVMRSPEDVILVVCGGDGTMAMVGIPWGLAKAVSRPVVRKDGKPILAARSQTA